MSTDASVIKTGIITFGIVSIIRPDVAHHALDVAEKAIDAFSGNKQEKDTEMSSENKKGRSKYN